LKPRATIENDSVSRGGGAPPAELPGVASFSVIAGRSSQAAVEAARLKPDAESAKGLSKEDLERLRALGYVQ